MRWIWWLVGFLGIVAAGVTIGLIVVKRMETGSWQAPSVQDYTRVVEAAVLPEPTPDPLTRTIFLERKAVTVRPGRDDAAKGISTVVGSGINKEVTTKAFKGSDKTWKSFVGCVQTLFKPFDVTVTDVRPTHDNFTMVIVGGKATDIGIKTQHVGGLAPFSDEVIPRAVVFTFAASLGNNVRQMCETAGMEVAHAFALDHGYLCKDVMTYLTGCGSKTFVDKDVRCGEKKARDCHNGQPTQNSYQHLLKLFGPRPVVPAPTTKPATTKPIAPSR